MKNVSIIVAVDKKNGIGIDGDLPWHLPSDLKHFQAITIGNKNNAVVMGKNTWLSLPEKFRPLKQRLNVVLSRENIKLPDGVLLFDNLEDGLDELIKNEEIKNIFIIGGGYLYKYALENKLIDHMYVTEIEDDFKCDTFFPEYKNKFGLVKKGDLHEEKGIKFRFCEYEITN